MSSNEAKKSGPSSSSTEGDETVIELLRTPGLSINYLDEEKRERLRKFVHSKHIEEGMSLGDLAKLIGNETSGYTSWLAKELGVKTRPFEESRLKAIREKRGSTRGGRSTGRRKTNPIC